MDNSVYVVTGATSGIGRAIVEKILRESKNDNDRIVVNYGHNEAKAQEFLEAQKEEDKPKIILIKADLSDYFSMCTFVREVIESTAKVDYLICNTGIGTYMKFDEYTFETWNKILNTNMSVPAFMIREFRQYMPDNSSIILMGSYAGRRPYSSSVVYSVSKAALVFMSEVLVKELEPKAIRINALAPGFIDTEWQKDRTDESRERVNAKIALHRFGRPEEVADMCYSVLKNQYMNGSVIDIHGGYDYF